jgi:hypothetical protein
MALTREQLLDELADLGIEVSLDNRVSRSAVQAALEWCPESVVTLGEKLDKLGIAEEPLKAPFHIELSPNVYREIAIKQLKAQRPDVDWEAILPEVPAKHTQHLGIDKADSQVGSPPLPSGADKWIGP